MKFFVAAAALVAAVHAEAEPHTVYAAGLPLTHAHLPYVYSYGKSAPCVNDANQPVPCADGYYAAPVAAIYGRKKREAEAEAEADPALLYGAYGYSAFPYAYGYAGYPYAYAAPAAVGLKSAPCVNAYNVPVPCARKRRDAEADAAVLYSSYGYPYAHPYAYGYAGVAPVAYAAAAHVVSAGVAAPHAVAATPYGLTHSSNVGVCTNYLGAQVPC